MTRSLRRRLSVASVAVASALLVASTVSAAVTWTLVPLDSSGNGPSAARTPAGNAAVAWWLPATCCTDVSSDGLALATGSGDSFTTAVITTSDLAYPDLAYGADGTAHIAAGIHNGDAGLGYVAYASGVATESTVTTDPLADRASIGVDSSGRPHIAYSTYLTQGLYIATLDAGTWTSELIWSGDARDPRIAVEADGTNHVVFTAMDPDTGSAAGIRYATDTSGSWVVSVATTDPSDAQPDVAVESTGIVDIVYAHQEGRGVGIVLLRTGANPKLIVRASADSPMIALGPTGAIHVAYWQFGGHGQGLRVTDNVKGRFVSTLVSTEGELGAPMALAVDSNGVAYAAFDIVGSCCPPTGGLVVAHN